MTTDALQDLFRTLGSSAAELDRFDGLDPQEAADAQRHLLRLVSAALELFVERADPDRPLPTVWMSPTRKFLGDSPDTIYTTVPVSARNRYRITVDPGAALYTGAVVYGRHADDGPVHVVTSAIDSQLRRDGADFVIDVGADVDQAGGAGLRIDDTAFWVMVRQYFAEPAPSRPGSVTVERIDRTVSDAPPDPGELASGVERAATWVAAQLRADQALDAMMTDPSGAVAATVEEVDTDALVSQFFPTPDIEYQGCRAALAEDQQLRIELTPPACRFWSIAVMTPWLESLEQRGVPASINGERAVPNDDGTVTVVVSERDPGCTNWIPLRGYRRVQIAYRVLLAEEPPAPPVFVVEPHGG